jgi:hypothetical protein
MKKVFLTLIALSVFWSIGFAQADTYYTRNATLTLNAELDGEALKLVTRELSVMLDYETAFIIIRFPVSSLETEADSLNAMLEKSRTEVVFDGKLGMEYVNTEDHPPMKFETEGWLIMGSSKALVNGKGELHHIGNTTKYACMLGLTMQLDFKDLQIPPPLSGLNENFEAIITQALLQRDKN